MLNDFFGLAFIILVIVGMYFFMRPKFVIGSKNLEPDSLKVALEIQNAERGISPKGL